MNQESFSNQKRERRVSIYAFLALLLGMFSYFWANSHPEYAWDGPIMLFVAAGLLLFVVRRFEGADVVGESGSPKALEGPSSGSAKGMSGANSSPAVGLWERLPLKQVARWRIVVFWVSVGLTVVLLSRLMVPNQPSYSEEVLLWLGAIGMFVLSVAPPVSRPREDLGLWWEVNRNTVLILALIMVVACGARLWNLEGIPSTVGGDEGSQGLEALRTISGDIRNPFTTGWLGMPTISFFYNSISFYFLGQTITALRLPWAVAGCASVLTTFWLITRLHGLRLGLMTAALLASYHYHIHYSRLGANNIADPFFVTLALLFLFRARDRNSPLDWAMAGVTAGVAQYFYPGARLTIMLLGACVLFFLWDNRQRRETFRNMLGGGLTVLSAFVITAAPMIQYAYRFPNDYNARLNQVGIIQSGWLENEIAIRGVSMWTPLWEQFQRAFLAFNVFPDRTVWYGSPKPLMDGIWAILFMLGLLYATLRLRERNLFPLVLWWWSVIILGGMMTESPPSTARLIATAPVACFFVAFALLRILQFLQSSVGGRNTQKLAPLLVVAVLLLSGLSIRWYFWEYTPLNAYGSRNGEIATAMGHFLAEELEADQVVVFFGPPQLYIDFSTIPYLAPQATNGISVHQPITQPPTAQALGVPANKRAYFIALSGRVSELDLIEQAYPGGRRFPVEDAQGEPLFWVYEPN
ncbi:MAG: ArnT family glycosyltransferase [Ardenticatenaceae bacterium]